MLEVSVTTTDRFNSFTFLFIDSIGPLDKRTSYIPPEPNYHLWLTIDVKIY